MCHYIGVIDIKGVLPCHRFWDWISIQKPIVINMHEYPVGDYGLTQIIMCAQQYIGTD